MSDKTLLSTLPAHVQIFAWFEERILENLPFGEPIKVMFPTEYELRNFIRYWMLWNIERGFLWVWLDNGTPVGGIVWRPCDRFDNKLRNIEYFDLDGDCLWADFLYAPNRWDDCVLPFIKATGKKYGGWFRRDNFALHIVEIDKLRPFKKALLVEPTQPSSFASLKRLAYLKRVAESAVIEWERGFINSVEA